MFCKGWPLASCECLSVFVFLFFSLLSPSDLSTLSIEPTKRTGSTLSHKLCLNVSVMLYPASRGRSCSTQEMDPSILSLWLKAGLGAKHQLFCLCAHEQKRKSWKGSSSSLILFPGKCLALEQLEQLNIHVWFFPSSWFQYFCSFLCL